MTIKPLISFVIPCYRSQNTVGFVISEIDSVMLDRASKYEYEIIAVVDGSPDDVFSVLKNIAETNKHVKVINFARNFGQTNARMAGYNFAKGDYIVTLDDDGQCPTAEVDLLLEPLQSGKDLAVAKYPHKTQSWFKNFGSKLNGMMGEKVIGMPKGFEMSNFFAFNKFLRDEIIKYDNPYPYLGGLFFRSTNAAVNVPMEERERVDGESTYSFSKMLRVWMNGFTSFSLKPLRLCYTAAIVFFVFCVISAVLGFVFNNGFWLIASCITFVGASITALMGVQGEYLGRLFIGDNKSPQFVVHDAVNLEE